MELKAFTTMLTQLGDLRVACGPMEINRPSRIQSMTHNHSRLPCPPNSSGRWIVTILTACKKACAVLSAAAQRALQ